MTRDEALAKFLASVITVWQKTAPDELRAIGSATLVLELGAEVVVTPTADTPWSDAEVA